MKKRTLTFVLLLLLVVSANVSVSQQWELYTSVDGLIEGSVRSIREDAKGYLWFITSIRGANVYDGVD